MGEVSCDILQGDNIYCLFIRYVDTTHEKITRLKSPAIENGSLSENVTQVIFYGGNLPIFPTELAEFLPNLKCIDIHGCGLREISKNDLKNFKKLEKLKLEGNKLKFLPANLFEESPKINQVSFKNNEIERIGSTLLENCENLLEADFRGNTNLNFHYKKKLNNLDELKWIIETKCTVVKSLQNLAVDVLKKSVNLANSEIVRFIADRLNIDDLSAKCENLINEQTEKEKNPTMWRINPRMKWLRSSKLSRHY